MASRGPSDTSDEVLKVQRRVRQAMPPERRMALVFAMSDDLRLVTLDGLRDRHPDADDAELALRLIERWHGSDTAALVRGAVTSRDR